MKKVLKKVLVVEDERYFHNSWRLDLGNKVMLISTLSIREAEEQFAANPDIAAIVIDACVPGYLPNTEPLVRKFRETFTGPIIAISSSPEYRAKLVSAGCDHECGRKYTLPQKLLEVLGL
jgi:DNA-binding response OmpR family regulator